jgi:tetratricopeptide (TPR) repeat protein
MARTERGVTLWSFLADETTPFMVSAIRVLGLEVLAAKDEGIALPDSEAVGRELLRLVFDARDGGPELPAVLTDLIADPDSEAAATGLTGCLYQAFQADPGLASAAAAMIARFYRRQADGGDVQALAGLGDFLYWDEPEAARAAYQEAVDAGHLHALIGLATVLRNVVEDEDAALALCQQAISSGDPDLAAEAMVELAQLNVARRDAAGARALFQQVIEARHPKWSAAVTVGLAGLLERLDDREAAEALYRQAIQAGNPDWSGRASFALGELLKRKGDAAGAKAAWQPVIDSADPERAGPAFTHLVNLLRDNHDVDGLRAAYPVAAARHTPDALYALDVLGQELDDLGDTDGAHAAWQQAIDAGYESAGDLRDRISPPEPEDEPGDDAGPDDLPPQFDPANMIRAGVNVLDHGLPDLPGTLSYKMAIPVAYWKAEQCAVPLVLRFSRHRRGTPVPMVMQVVYSRTGDGWTLPRYVFGSGFYHDPIARRRDRREMDGRPMVGGGTSRARQVTPGYPAFIATGRAGPEVKYLAVTQDGHEDRRPLESHFGAWVVCTEQPGSFEVAGIDQNGTVLASLRYPSLPSRWQEFRSLPAGPGVAALTASLLRMPRRTGDTSVLPPTRRMVHVIARAAPATHTALPNSTHGSPP